MILYLSRSESANLLDKIALSKSLSVRKMTGSFCLSEVISRDIKKFADWKYFCIERLAVSDKDGEFLEALQTFQSMCSKSDVYCQVQRIIVINESMREMDSLTRGLIEIGVTDVVTTPIMADKLRQLTECLSDEGMTKYKPKPSTRSIDTEKKTLAERLIINESEDEQYRFDCVNINVSFAGATRRVGTTTSALGFASYVQAHGGTACYVAMNSNEHLESIATAFNFDTEEDYYTYSGIDFYDGTPPKYDYNFVITDYGNISREVIKKYRESDVHILCGASYKLFEVIEFADALKQIKFLKPHIFTYIPNPEYGQLFHSTVTHKPTVIMQVRNMLDNTTNSQVFRSIIDKYIVRPSNSL